MKAWTKSAAALALGIGLLAAGPAEATIPLYPNSGLPNLQLYSFTAAADGELLAYFGGRSASFENILGLLVNGSDSGINGLNSLTSTAGDSLSFGNVAAGDSLTFYIRVNPDPGPNDDPGNDRQFFSDWTLNFDNTNHVYSTAYAGGDFGIPAGTYVTFEDLDYGGDFNYADLDFVFTNVRTIETTAVPEPSTWALMLLGFGAIGAAMRRRPAQVQLRYG